KFDTEIANSLMHLVRLYCTARSFSFASFPCSLCPAHNSSCPVYGTVKRITTLFGIHSLQNYRNVSHTPADKTFLPWCSWRGSFTHNDIFFSAMNFFPSIIMMVVDFFHSFCDLDVQYLVDNDISTSISVLSSELHCLIVHCAEL